MKFLSKSAREKKKREEYLLNVEYLMEMVSQSQGVFEQKTPRGRSAKWIIDGHTIDNKTHFVYSIEAFDKEEFWFHLKLKD